MTSAEIIEQIEALSPEEQREVSRFLRELARTDATSSAGRPAVRYATDEQARVAGEEILEKHAELFRKLAE